MTLQARMSANDRRLYNPSRDVAHNFKDVLQLVVSRLEDNAWPELTIALGPVSLDDLEEACSCYCVYVASALKDPNKDMLTSMLDSGFCSCKPAAQVAVMAMLGVCYAGIQHAGIREATVDNEGPLMTVSELLVDADRLQKYLKKPIWQRKLLRLWERVQAAFKLMRS